MLRNITLYKEFLCVMSFSMVVTKDRYTRYYVYQSSGGEIGPVYRARFMMQRINGIGSFCRGHFRFVKPLLY